jgi:hypothetical protein
MQSCFINATNLEEISYKTGNVLTVARQGQNDFQVGEELIRVELWALQQTIFPIMQLKQSTKTCTHISLGVQEECSSQEDTSRQ